MAMKSILPSKGRALRYSIAIAWEMIRFYPHAKGCSCRNRPKFRQTRISAGIAVWCSTISSGRRALSLGEGGHRARGLRCGAGPLAQAERSRQAARARERKGVVPS